MIRKEFIFALMEDEGILREDASKITDVVFSQVRKQLLLGREVRINDVGSFRLKYRKPSVMNNNVTGTKHQVGPRVRVKFRVFPSMQRALNAILAKEMDSEYKEEHSRKVREDDDDDDE